MARLVSLCPGTLKSGFGRRAVALGKGDALAQRVRAGFGFQTRGRGFGCRRAGLLFRVAGLV
ncbi:hypothetical protein, partial [Acidomonas methanolica]|uniref:hypothetical protein n=1 Tax=Acidomonas methanolica TaxID=437 RepID=UPI0022324C08